ncbi:hypothetical protein Tco_0332286 [Tanacetum coccineum]
MCPSRAALFKPSNSVIDLGVSNQFDLLVFLLFRIIMLIIKTFHRGNNFNLKQRKHISTQGQIIDTPVHQTVVNQPVSYRWTCSSEHTVCSKLILKDMSQTNDAVLRETCKNQDSTFGSGTLPGNTVSKPKEASKTEARRTSTPVIPNFSSNPNPVPNVAHVVTPVPKAFIHFLQEENDEGARKS